MFAKLLKHEFKSTAGVLGMMTLAAVFAAAVGAGVMRYIMNAAQNRSWNAAIGLLSTLLTFVMIGLVAYYIGAHIYLLVNFNNSKFGDRGYLTFTLPVHGWQIFLSSLLNVLLWSCVVTAVLFLGMMAIMIVSVAGLEGYPELHVDANMVFDVSGEVLWEDVAYAIYSLLSMVSGLTLMLTCITAAGTLFRRHRLLASVGIYYVLSLVWSVASTLIMNFAVNVYSQWTSGSYYIFESLILAAAAAVCFCLSSWLMEKKINLN